MHNVRMLYLSDTENAMLDNTKHTCGGPKFGRLAAPGICSRCDELRYGAEPRGWGGGQLAMRNGRLVRLTRRETEANTIAAIRAHDCKKSGCGPVCTAFDW